MGRDRTLRERLEQLLPDPTNSTVGYVVTVTSYVDPRGITQWTYTLAPGSGGGGVTSVTATAPIASSGGTTPDISLNNSAVTPGSYTNANITVDAHGLVTAASNGSAGTGTVTSVALVMPAEWSVAGSPITGAGTFTVTKANETANFVWAGPTSGGAAAPTFRALVKDDLPAISTGASWTVGIAAGPSIIATQFDVGKVPANYTVTGWQFEMDRAGAFSIEVQKATSGAFPTYSTMSGTSTSTGGLPIIASGQSASSSDVSLWSSTSIGIGDSIRLIIHANTAAPGWFSLMLTVSRVL